MKKCGRLSQTFLVVIGICAVFFISVSIELIRTYIQIPRIEMSGVLFDKNGTVILGPPQRETGSACNTTDCVMRINNTL